MFSNVTLSIEDVYEPHLIRQGLPTKTPRGRIATSLAHKHLGIKDGLF